MYYQPVEKYAGKKRDYTKQREFVSCKNSYNYMSYVDTGSADKIIKDYTMYVGNGEKSTGVFGEKGLLNEEENKSLRKQLRETESNIWDMLISFREDFGDEYCGSYEQAYSFIKEELPKFFERVGLNKNNMVWYAGLHENTENKHIHISFFEKEKLFYDSKGNLTFKSGKIKIADIEKSKIIFEKKLTSASKQLYFARKILLDKYKLTLNPYELAKSVKKKLNDLFVMLPSEGRVSYDSENMKFLKSNVDEITEFILLKNKDTHRSFKEYLSELEKVKQWKKKRYGVEEDSYLNDLFRRLGNQTIQYAMLVGRTHKAIESQNDFGRRQKHYKKKMRERELDYCFRLLDYFAKEEQKHMEEFKARLQKWEYERRRAEMGFEM